MTKDHGYPRSYFFKIGIEKIFVQIYIIVIIEITKKQRREQLWNTGKKQENILSTHNR